LKQNVRAAATGEKPDAARELYGRLNLTYDQRGKNPTSAQERTGSAIPANVQAYSNSESRIVPIHFARPWDLEF